MCRCSRLLAGEERLTLLDGETTRVSAPRSVTGQSTIFDTTGQADSPPDFLGRRRQRRVGEQHHDAQCFECVAHHGIDRGARRHLPRFVLLKVRVGCTNQVPRRVECLAWLHCAPGCVSVAHRCRGDFCQWRITARCGTNAATFLLDDGRHARGEIAEIVCYDAGDIELDIYKGRYCVACEAYYTDEELEGDKCPIHKTPANYVEEENYFFRLSRFEQRLLDWYDKHPDAIVPDFRRNEVLGFIKGGLNDFSVSRKSLKWGIPLPWNADHVAYVWFDALANYITAHGYGSDDERFASRWPVDWHFIGKDIIRF
ncbi:MAG: hypothetical protein EBV17_05095, partial [Actinobacteria bacterium]|nr:hypothetical protein [Actinomycetota bacterium]